jgi:hypothetical protein
VREHGKKDKTIQLGFVSKKDADLRRLAVLNELLSGAHHHTPTVRLFLGEFCDKFLADFAQGTRAPGTVRLYRSRLKKMRQGFQGYRLDQINREGLERCIGAQPLNNRSKNILLSVLRLVFQKAVEWQ